MNDTALIVGNHDQRGEADRLPFDGGKFRPGSSTADFPHMDTILAQQIAGRKAKEMRNLDPGQGLRPLFGVIS